jgi:hypothetical protein
MFVKVFDKAFRNPVELDLYSSTVLPYGLTSSEILRETGQCSYFSRHPPEILRKAIRVYAGLLGGREEMRIPFPSFSLLNTVPEPPSINTLLLDLTKDQIEITEEAMPVDAEGNIQLHATRTRLRILSYDQESARNNSETAALENPQIGQTIPGKGIFAGVWTPKDRNGKSLGKVFNVFAAPEDLTDETGRKTLLTFKDAAKHLTTKRNWHGHDGGDFADDAILYKSLADGSAIGKWFIPPQDLLTDNLYANKDKGDFKGTFTTAGHGAYRECPVWYWSCTELRDVLSNVWNTRFSDGVVGWLTIDYYRLSCRPCRVEALPARRTVTAIGPKGS